MNEITFTEYFLKEFPEFEAAYHEHLEDYGELLAHVFYGDDVCLILVKLLKQNNDKQKLKRLFQLLEVMAVEGNEEVQNVLQVSILEVLGDDKEVLQRANFYMGEHTRIASKEIERFWGRD
ncbi:hypothetical protein FLK61_37435 [Paenalkalicoccus suaedae]|uniref:DUF7674 domain-containing protein n=1 Tax=Paenalkalicoccus suaedae TaxID=2592382 RepID=A0A859FGR4_9BACI|nr:hypothetical protein [Paenalkalicoccus suaedae]QKS72319.1 hypothetical protein FLK61_37435 [Paenalkalicoccus suaedae]